LTLRADTLPAVQFRKDKSDTPSNFTLKLRKHVRTRRLEDVRQLGVDRVVDFTFGSGEATYHIILELYSQARLGIMRSPRRGLALGAP
jgi:predicted ribosome quality control (RQC) complex YloA/Tae2 family protein